MIRRPRIHFTPQRNWMNDPNGLVFHNGRYHLFYQYNPYGADHANMSWGHASSSDLVQWDEHPVAIACDRSEEIFSGSAVVDTENSAGFAGPGQTALVAIYTSVDAVTRIQRQALAYSVDDGTTWAKYAGNPVLDRDSPDFRDPKVFRYDGPAGSYWVMVAVEAVQRQVVLYRSTDLKSWTLLSTYGPAGAVGGVWECPDLFPLALDGDANDIRWVLVISLNPGGIAGGSGTQYVIGAFDGVRFTPERPVPDELAEVDWLDHGRDCYAGVTFNGLPTQERTFIAWMGNWDYAAHVPSEPWRGAMTVARRLSLTTVVGRPQLRSTPVLPVGAEALRTDAESGDTDALPEIARIDVRIGMPTADAEVILEITGEAGSVRVRCTAECIAVDRTKAGGFAEEFPSVEAVSFPAGAPHTELIIVLDTCSIEVFANGGIRAITDLVLVGGNRRLSVTASDGATVEALTVIDLGAGT